MLGDILTVTIVSLLFFVFYAIIFGPSRLGQIRDRNSLRSRLSEWTDWDGAAFELGIIIGLFPDDKSTFQTEFKHVFWTDNPVGNKLHIMLDGLVDLGILERRDEPDIQYKWRER